MKRVIFAANGAYLITDDGEQLPGEGGTAWLTILQSKLDRGVIDEATQVVMVGWPAPPLTVGELIRQGKLLRKS